MLLYRNCKEEEDFNIFDKISFFNNDNKEYNIIDVEPALNSFKENNKEEIEKLKLLPSNLLEIEENKNAEEISIVKEIKNNKEQNSFLDGLNINSKPYFPKKRLLGNKISNKNENKKYFINPNNNRYYFNYNNNKKDKIKKNKKKKFYEKEGDWLCYKCKNINFAFRKKCNKCGISLEESENLFLKVLQKYLKIMNSNKTINM